MPVTLPPPQAHSPQARSAASPPTLASSRARSSLISSLVSLLVSSLVSALTAARSLTSSVLPLLCCATMAQGRETRGIPSLTPADGQRWVESELNRLSPLSEDELLTRWSVHRLELGARSTLCVELVQSLQRELRWAVLQRRWCAPIEPEPQRESADVELPSLGARYCWGARAERAAALALPGAALPALSLPRALSSPRAHARWAARFAQPPAALPAPPSLNPAQSASLTRRLGVGGAGRCRRAPLSPPLHWLQGFRAQLQWASSADARTLRSSWRIAPNDAESPDSIEAHSQASAPPQAAFPQTALSNPQAERSKRRLPFALQPRALRWLEGEAVEGRGRLQRLSLSFMARLPRSTNEGSSASEGHHLRPPPSAQGAHIATLESVVSFSRQGADEALSELAERALWLERGASGEAPRARAR